MKNYNYVIVPYARLTEAIARAGRNTSLSTVRRSNDGTLAVLKWRGDKPNAIRLWEIANALNIRVYSWDEIVQELEKPAWASAERVAPLQTRLAVLAESGEIDVLPETEIVRKATWVERHWPWIAAAAAGAGLVWAALSGAF